MVLYSAADNDRDIATRRFYPAGAGVNGCDIVGPLPSRASEHTAAVLKCFRLRIRYCLTAKYR